jgi:hypothetical protein
MVRWRRSIAVLLVAGAVSGCGHAGLGAHTHATRATAAAPRAHPSPNGAAAAVRAYVKALDERDRAGFCSLLAPWVKGRLGAYLKRAHLAREALPDAQVCPLAARFIGFYEGDTAQYRWAGARIKSLGRPRWVGDVVAVDMRFTNRYARLANATDPPPPQRLEHDRVYLVPLGSRWLIAKLGVVADSAAIGVMDQSDPLSPPDLAAERAWYRNRLAATSAAQRRDGATAGHPYMDCARIGRVQRIADPTGDLQPRAANLPSVDLTQVSFAGTADRICFDFETVGPIKAPSAMSVQIRSGPRGEGGFALDAVLTKPGQALVGVRYPSSAENALRADVGVAGRQMSLVMSHDAFPADVRGALSSFTWTAQSIYNTPVGSAYHGTQFTDSVPESNRPPGRFP